MKEKQKKKHNMNSWRFHWTRSVGVVLKVHLISVVEITLIERVRRFDGISVFSNYRLGANQHKERAKIICKYFSPFWASQQLV